MINKIKLFDVFSKEMNAVLNLISISFYNVRIYQDELKFRSGCYRDAFLSCG